MSVTTTHDPRGGGDPRLIFSVGGETQIEVDQREFLLLPGVTTIGSADDSDLQLDGLEAHHAEIRRDSADEYVYFQVSERGGSTVDGVPMGRSVLRTGNRVEIGTWTMSYYREEFADHGRPYGGREGGNNGYQRPQEIPRPRGTSEVGGHERAKGNSGEYF